MNMITLDLQPFTRDVCSFKFVTCKQSNYYNPRICIQKRENNINHYEQKLLFYNLKSQMCQAKIGIFPAKKEQLCLLKKACRRNYTEPYICRD